MSKALRNMVVRISILVLVVSTIMSWFFMKLEFNFLMKINGQSAITGIKAVLDQDGHFEEYASSVMETYRSIPEEIRKDVNSDEYRAFFEKYRTSEYVQHISGIFLTISNTLSMQDKYIVAIDREHEALVYLLDISATGLNKLHEIGEWIPLTPEILSSGDSFLNTDFQEKSTEASLSPEPSYVSFESQNDDLGTIQTVGIVSGDPESGSEILILCSMPDIFTGVTTTFFIVAYFIILFIVILFIVIVTRIRMNQKIIKPINSISRAVEEYARQRTEGNTLTACFSGLSVNSMNELNELAETLTKMEQDLGAYEKDLKTAVAREERMNFELSLSSEIQSNMLPDAKKAFPDRKDFSIYASMTPAREVGGDFYDFFLIDDDHLGLTIADVSGKGIPAALFMMSSMIIISNFASLGLSPGEVLERSNKKICASNVLNMFVTVWFGILDLKTGVVTAANAGHEYPALRNANGDFELLHDRHDLVIGAMENVKYREYSFTLEKGGTLFLYTDGVPEAANAGNELYGTDRMLRALSSAEDRSPEGLCSALRADIDRFIDEAPQFDDLTTLCVQYHPER